MNGSRNATTTANECRYVPVLPSNHSKYAMIGLQVITMIIAIPGNLITILTILRSQKLRKNVTYIFVMSVTVADFLVGMVA